MAITILRIEVYICTGIGSKVPVPRVGFPIGSKVPVPSLTSFSNNGNALVRMCLASFNNNGDALVRMCNCTDL